MIKRRAFDGVPFKTRWQPETDEVVKNSPLECFAEVNQQHISVVENWLSAPTERERFRNHVKIPMSVAGTTAWLPRPFVEDWVSWKRQMEERTAERRELFANARAWVQTGVAVVAAFASIAIAASSWLNYQSTLELRAIAEQQALSSSVEQ